jgi:hypothetical protein
MWFKNCVHIYVNRKVTATKTIPGMREWRIKENDGKGEFKYDIFNILQEFF